MSEQRNKKPGNMLVSKAEVVSKKGSTIIVKRLHLTDAGREALRTTSTGITSEPRSGSGWVIRKKDLTPA